MVLMSPRKHHAIINMAKDFKQGALVWAKMKGFSPWPAQVSFPSDGKIPKSKKPQHYVFFFGTNDYAWIPDQHIVPHSEAMLANSRRYKKISWSMQSAILEIEDASQNVAKKVKLLTKDKIKKEPVSSPPPPLESIPEKPKAPKRKHISKKMMKPKVLSYGVTRKIKLLKKDEIKKEPVSSSPPPESTPEKSNSRKRKRTTKTMKPTRMTQRCGKKITLLKKDKIKKELVSSPLRESTPKKPKTPKRKPKMMKPERMTQRCGKKITLLKKDKIKKELVGSPLRESTPKKPKTPKRKPKMMKPERMTQRCGKKITLLKKDKIKKELVSSPLRESTPKKPKTPKRKPKMMKPERMTQRCGKKITLLKKDKIKKELVSSPLRESTPKNPKRKPKMMKPERMTKRCEKLRKDKIKKELKSSPPLAESIPKKRKKPKRKQVPKKNSKIRKSAKKISASDMMSKDVDKDIKIKKDEVSDEDSDEDYSLLMANVPPNNGYPNVAVIPPYNDDSKANVSSSRRRELSGPGASGSKKFTATSNKIGFLGLGEMGYVLVNNLVTTGHNVTIWNKSISDKYDCIVQKGAKTAQCAAEVIRECDITFCCVSDPEAAKCVVFQEFGVLAGLDGSGGNKAYVELTTIDPETSQEISEAIVGKGGRYLEAQLFGTRQDAMRNSMVILAAGDRELFTECNSMFPVWARHAFYMGYNIGHAAKMNLILSMLAGTTYAALGESIALAERCGISPFHFMDIVGAGPMNFPLLMAKGRAMITNDETVYTPVKHQQKDLDLAVSLGHSTQQPLALAVAANEVYKRAKPQFSECDVSAVQKCYI